MKTIVRRGVFETNSSSAHSLTFNSHDNLDQTLTPNDGVIVVRGEGEYGWEQDVYSTAYFKTDYLYQQWFGREDKIELLKQAIEEHTGAPVIFKDPTGYIDHQSMGICDGIQTVEDVKQFLFNSQNRFITDNDN